MFLIMNIIDSHRLQRQSWTIILSTSGSNYFTYGFRNYTVSKVGTVTLIECQMDRVNIKTKLIIFTFHFTHQLIDLD